MNTITSAIKTFVANEDGVTAIEYGLIAALIGVGIAVAATAMSTELKNLFGHVGTELAKRPT